MARVPRYETQYSPTGQPSRVKSLGAERRSPQPVADESAVFRGLNQVGDALFKVSRQVADARNVSEMNKSIAEYYKFQNNLALEFESPEFRQANHPKEWGKIWNDRIREYQDELIDRFQGSSPGRRDLQGFFEKSRVKSTFEAQKSAISYERQTMKAEIPRNLQTYLEMAYEASNKNNTNFFGDLMGTVEGYLDGQVAGGIITEGEKNTFLNAFRNDMNKTLIDGWIQNDPSTVLTALDEQDLGLSQIEIDVAKEKALNRMVELENQYYTNLNRKEKIAKQRLEQIQDQTAIDFQVRLNNGELNLSDVNAAGRVGALSFTDMKHFSDELTTEGGEVSQNNPYVLDEINENIINKDFDLAEIQLKDALRNKEIKGSTYTSRMKALRSDRYDRAVDFLKDNLNPSRYGFTGGAAERNAREKSILSRAQNYMDQEISNGYKPMIAAKMAVGKFNQLSEKKNSILPVGYNKYYKGALENMTLKDVSNVRESLKSDVENYTKDEFNSAMDNIDRIEDYIEYREKLSELNNDQDVRYKGGYFDFDADR